VPGGRTFRPGERTRTGDTNNGVLIL